MTFSRNISREVVATTTTLIKQQEHAGSLNDRSGSGERSGGMDSDLKSSLWRVLLVSEHDSCKQMRLRSDLRHDADGSNVWALEAVLKSFPSSGEFYVVLRLVSWSLLWHTTFVHTTELGLTPQERFSHSRNSSMSLSKLSLRRYTSSRGVAYPAGERMRSRCPAGWSRSSSSSLSI